MSDDSFEPKIVGFLCNWCSYRAADLAGTARIAHAPNIRIIRVMCSGRVDPTFVLKALSLGADGVMIAGCHPGECHYIEQNYKAMRRFNMLQHTLRAMGVEEERVQLVWASAAEGQQLAEAIDKLVAGRQGARSARLVPELGRERRTDQGAGRHRQRAQRGDGGTAMSKTANTAASRRRPRPSRKANWPSTGPLPAAVARSPSWASTPRSWTWPRRSISSSAPASPTARSATSNRWPTARSTSACSTAACAPASRSTWPSCCAASRRCWWPSAPALPKAAFPGWPISTPARKSSTTPTAKRCSTENPTGVRPQAVTKVAEGNLHLPVFYDTLKTLDQTVKVDYYLPGCPPESDRIWEAIEAIVTGTAAAGRFRDRFAHDRVRFLSSHADREEDQGIQTDLGGDSRSGHVPAGAGHHLLRDRHPGRLRLSLPAGQLALHRLLRSERRRRGFRRAADERAGLRDRFPGSPGDR